ncbi:MAG: hypothetical protein E7B29_15725, partial [Mixta calida]|nr:hypothetical protein [Mixta calida]
MAAIAKNRVVLIILRSACCYCRSDSVVTEAQPQQWLQQRQHLETLSRFSGAPVDQVPELVEGNTYLNVDQQIAQLGQPVSKAISDTAQFLKEQGKVAQVAPDYRGYVTDRFVRPLAKQ